MAGCQNQSPDNVIVIPEDDDIERFQSSAGKLVEISKKKIEATRELVESGKNLIEKSLEGKEYRNTGTKIYYGRLEPPQRLLQTLEAALATEKALKNLYKACSEMNLEVADDSSVQDVRKAYDVARCDIKEAALDVYDKACGLEPNSSHPIY